MTILVTGSSGKTATHLANILAPVQPILVASRSPSSNAAHPMVRFDWLDETTWKLPFDHEQAEKSSIRAVYVVLPDILPARQKAISFVKFAHHLGVNRFVLLSAWENSKGGDLVGSVHAQLEDFAREKDVEFAVLRPHFFMENFAESYHLKSIKNEGKIYTAAENGKKPFISARDIAAVACHCLTEQTSRNTDYILTGAEPLTYDDVARIFTHILGKDIQHIRITEDELRQKLLQEDFTDEMADYMAKLDTRVAQGEGWQPTDEVKNITGNDPRTFEQFVMDNKHIWI